MVHQGRPQQADAHAVGAAVEGPLGVERIKQALAAELADLAEMEAAGLLRVEPGRVFVLPPGRMLVRAISMVFDARLRANRTQNRYSKVI